MTRTWKAALLAGAAIMTAGPTLAQDKPLSIYIGYSTGGGYDVYGRIVARHIGKHMPGTPNVIVNNMPGAGSLRLANWLYTVAPKDGSVMGVVARGVAFDTLLGMPGASFEATKFNWIGSANDEVSVCVAWQSSGIKTFQEAIDKGLIVGGTGGSADTDQFPRVFNGVLGAKFKIVTGYPGGNDINLAMERGEVLGRCGWSWSSVITTKPDWLKDKKMNVLVQLALSKHPDLPDVPLISEFAKNDLQRGVFNLVFARQLMGRPFLAPPGVPADKVATLRKAFMETMKDKDFLGEAEKAKLEITPVKGEVVQKVVAEAYAMPPEVIALTAKVLKE